jgi:hypothetical protein
MAANDSGMIVPPSPTCRFEECHEILAVAVAAKEPVYADTFELCQAGDPATLYTMIHAATEDQECSIHLPTVSPPPHPLPCISLFPTVPLLPAFPAQSYA